jgi:ribose-phosphate pyrophosphokinase
MPVSGQDNSKVMFLTPEYFAREQTQKMTAPRGRVLIAGCKSGSYLSKRVVQRYESLLADAGSSEKIIHLENIDKRFTDSETCVRLDVNVSGCDVFVIQSLFDPVSGSSIDQNYMAFFIALRAFIEHGANHVTGVLPYLAYARQDKPTKFTREPVTARLMADLSVSAGMDRLIVWEPHCDQIKGFYGAMPVNALESLSLFIDEFSQFKNRDDVIAVAPDAGASKFITHFGRALNIKCAIASKHRPIPEEVVIEEIIGDFEGKKTAIVLDDMISNAGTTYALIKKLVDEKGITEVFLGVSHNLCVGKAGERLLDLYNNHGLSKVIVTNSIPQTEQFINLPFVKVRCLSDTIARTINRIHYNRSVSEVFYHP